MAGWADELRATTWCEYGMGAASSSAPEPPCALASEPQEHDALIRETFGEAAVLDVIAGLQTECDNAGERQGVGAAAAGQSCLETDATRQTTPASPLPARRSKADCKLILCAPSLPACHWRSRRPPNFVRRLFAKPRRQPHPAALHREPPPGASGPRRDQPQARRGRRRRGRTALRRAGSGGGRRGASNRPQVR